MHVGRDSRCSWFEGGEYILSQIGSGSRRWSGRSSTRLWASRRHHERRAPKLGVRPWKHRLENTAWVEHERGREEAGGLVALVGDGILSGQKWREERALVGWSGKRLVLPKCCRGVSGSSGSLWCGQAWVLGERRAEEFLNCDLLHHGMSALRGRESWSISWTTRETAP